MANTKKGVEMSQAQGVSIHELRDELKGEVVVPDDPGYDEARQVFFKGIDRKPAAVARVAGAEDVARVVTAAREDGLELAVRSGGHSRAGYGTSEGGIVIDLSAMKALDIDADAKTASVQTGITAGQYTTATGEAGLVTGLGDAGSVGLGGITLAGGVGFLARKNGLTIDDLLAVELVTADGEVVEVTEESDPDLFWALRGGESNFGVATRFTLRLHEISEIVGGMLMLPATPEVITGFIEAADAAPEELSTIANVLLAPPMPFIPEDAHGKPVLMGLFAYVGPTDQGDSVIAPFRALGEPYADMVRPMRYPELYEGPEPEAQLASGTNFFADSLESTAAEAILEQLPQSTAMMKAVQLRVLGGALARVPNDATAFGHRDRRLMVNVSAMYADPSETETHQSWVDGLASSLGKNGAGGYVGFLGDEDEETLRAAYPGGNWDRLRKLKRRYDPDNVFRLNHNIPPAG
jgi:FAD/FMN-containing dehydrogenase